MLGKIFAAIAIVLGALLGWVSVILSKTKKEELKEENQQLKKQTENDEKQTTKYVEKKKEYEENIQKSMHHTADGFKSSLDQLHKLTEDGRKRNGES